MIKRPTPAQVKAERLKNHETQTKAATALFTSCRVWQRWESGERSMHPAFFAYYKLVHKLKGD